MGGISAKKFKYWEMILKFRIDRHQEKMMGQRGKLRALAGICHVHESYF